MTTTTTAPTSITLTREIDSPLDHRKQELIENVSFLEAQPLSSEEHLAKLKRENDQLETVTCGRIWSNCHKPGHNRNTCRGTACDSHTKCRLKDKHPELGKSISVTQKNISLLRKNKDIAKQTIDHFMLQVKRSCGSFFSIMRPCLKQLNPVVYLKRQQLDKDLLYLHKILENKVPPESEDWRLLPLIDSCKGQVGLQGGTRLDTPAAMANPSEKSYTCNMNNQ